MDMDQIINKYNNEIAYRYSQLINVDKEPDNYLLAKIFEYYTCIKLAKGNNEIYLLYEHIDNTFKENNQMNRKDCGIDCCNMTDTIVQCKLRNNSLTWTDCATFFASQNIFDLSVNKTVVRWDNLIISRNSDSILAPNLKEKSKLFIDITLDKDKLIKYCKKCVGNFTVGKTSEPKVEEYVLRDYQIEAIDLITNNSANTTICLPTGCGKNSVIIGSLKPKNKYLILVPRIILMDQLKDEIIKIKPEFEKHIQTIGDGNNEFSNKKNITICVYNSVPIIQPHIKNFHKIFVDEAHHINIPEIYTIEDDGEYTDGDLDDGEYTDEELDDGDYIDEEYIDGDLDGEYIDEEQLVDDLEDEIKETIGFNKIIKSFRELNNNVYLSATIDKTDDFLDYRKDIRDMIEQDYLCDYTIKVPIFSNDATNEAICKYLIKNYRSIIIYCNSHVEGKQINKLMNNILAGCSDYVDCTTKKNKRNEIINNFKSGKLLFLVNVRILVEGFNAPITTGVCFLHMPYNHTTLVQIIGRALRKHDDKIMSNIILPYSVDADADNIKYFLQVMAKNDSRIMKSYKEKLVGGYISLEFTNETLDKNQLVNGEFRYEMIYDSMGKLRNGPEIWVYKLNQVKQYIDANHKRPSQTDPDNDVKQMGSWISNQQKNYPKEAYIMADKHIRSQWKAFIENPKYKDYFITNEEAWSNMLSKVKQYIDANHKRPGDRDPINDVKQLGAWIGRQQKNYPKEAYIMADKHIRSQWKAFIENPKYKDYFITNEEAWLNALSKVKQYIDANNKRPGDRDPINDVKQMGKWIGHQQTNYPKEAYIMADKHIRSQWKAFIENPKYKKYFITLPNKNQPAGPEINV